MNRSFKTTFNSKKQSFDKIGFKKENSILPMNFNEKNTLLTSTFNGGSSLIQDVKFEPNTTMPEDIYYDEIIYYDGGGVEGYGD